MKRPHPPTALLAALAALALCAPAAWAQDEPAADEQAPAEAEAEAEAAAEPEPPAPPIGAVRRRELKAAPETGREEPAPREPAARPAAPRPGGGHAQAAQPEPPPLQPATWDPGNQKPPTGLRCAAGKTPALSRINLVIHNRPRPGKVVLDSTPITCDKEFCVKAGFTNRNCCPLGAEGQQARVDCELLVLGVDPDDGIPGPHWMFRGNGEIWKRENPFLADVKFPPGGGGTATVCNNIKPVVCNSIRVP